MIRILYVHNGRERFVLDDLALLRRTYDVTDWYQPQRQFNPLHLLRLVRSHDLVFCWFASWHAFAPVLLAHHLGRPSIVVVGGYDTACVPEAGYGAQRGGLPRVVARHVIRLASRLVTNSVAARTEAVINAGAEADKISVIYHGVEPLPSGSFQARELIALTVGGVWHENLLRKGLLPFVQAAAYLPDVRFVVAGRWFDDSVEVLREAAGQNVELRGFVSDGALADLYARSSVYVQASMHEGFGLSVAEAMSAGCIPVVTRVGALPEVVGASGVFAHTNKPQDIAQAIKRAARMPASHRILARQRVLTDFTMQQRHHSLVHLINSLDTTTIKAISI